MSLDFATILAVQDITRKLVSIPEWGGDVYVRMLSGTERDAMEAEHNANKGKPLLNFRARIAARFLCNEAGERLCTDKQVAELGAKSSVALDRIVEAGMSLNGIGNEESTKLLGESDSAPSGASGSSSP